MSDLPDFVTPGQPVEALWGNDVVAALNDAITTLNGLLPIGMIAGYGGTTEPPNWLLCRGQAVSTTTYTELYAVVGDRFNQGMAAPPAGTFRVPNMQARYPVGSNAGSSIGMGTYWSGGGVGEIAGSFDPVMPTHQHAVPDHLHWVDLWSGPQNAHHDHQAAFEFNFYVTGFDNQIALNRGSPSIGYYLQHRTWSEEGQDHAHRTTGWSGAADRDLSTNFQGGGAQIPPGVAMNFIIRAR